MYLIGAELLLLNQAATFARQISAIHFPGHLRQKTLLVVRTLQRLELPFDVVYHGVVPYLGLNLLQESRENFNIRVGHSYAFLDQAQSYDGDSGRIIYTGEPRRSR